MSVLEISQIIFNLIISVAVIVATVLIGIIAIYIIKFIKYTKSFLENVGKESFELHKKIKDFIDGILSLSFMPKFFKKKNK